MLGMIFAGAAGGALGVIVTVTLLVMAKGRNPKPYIVTRDDFFAAHVLAGIVANPNLMYGEGDAAARARAYARVYTDTFTDGTQDLAKLAFESRVPPPPPPPGWPKTNGDE